MPEQPQNSPVNSQNNNYASYPDISGVDGINITGGRFPPPVIRDRDAIFVSHSRYRDSRGIIDVPNDYRGIDNAMREICVVILEAMMMNDEMGEDGFDCDRFVRQMIEWIESHPDDYSEGQAVRIKNLLNENDIIDIDKNVIVRGMTFEKMWPFFGTYNTTDKCKVHIGPELPSAGCHHHSIASQ